MENNNYSFNSIDDDVVAPKPLDLTLDSDFVFLSLDDDEDAVATPVATPDTPITSYTYQASQPAVTGISADMTPVSEAPLSIPSGVSLDMTPVSETPLADFPSSSFESATLTTPVAVPKKPPLWKRALKEVAEYVIMFAAVVAVVLFLENFIIINAKIPSASMETTIMTGDRIIGNRLAYSKTSLPQRFDIIIFKYPDDESQLFIKRIIGMPGDTVEIHNGGVYINGSEEPLDDSYCFGDTLGDFGPYYVPSDSYFVMGDNRNNSYDSRFWDTTYVTGDQILGKAVFRYYPFSSAGPIASLTTID